MANRPTRSPSTAAPVAGRDLIGRRHPAYGRFEVRWRWLQDSLEGGDRYRYAVYGSDEHNLPVRNLVRHKREYPSPTETPAAWTDPYNSAFVPSTDDDYNLRLRRTPVPTFVAEAVGRHLNRIFSREVVREGPDELTAWWKDVDGAQTDVDRWMSETVGPLLLVLGQLDILFDRPVADRPIDTKADENAAGVARCLARVITPENLLWWALDDGGRYVEALVREELDLNNDGAMVPHFRHWTPDGWTLYDKDGEVRDRGDHGYGRVPIVRVFTRRKVGWWHCGQSDYEATAEKQREDYNLHSELILSDTTQAHPLLQGPEDYVQADGTVPIGPSWLLPQKKNGSGAEARYTGFSVVDFPKGAAESIRANRQALRDSVDRENCLAKPAGTAGTGAGTVSQSGISKGFDQLDLNDLLSRRTTALQQAERIIAEFALTVIRGRPVEGAAIDQTVEIRYPAEFDLFSADDLARATTELQGILSLAGSAPRTEYELCRRLVRVMLPGLADAVYEAIDEELKTAIDDAARRHQENREADAAALNSSVLQLEAGTTVDVPHPKDTPAAGAGPPAAQPKAVPKAGAKPSAKLKSKSNRKPKGGPPAGA